MSQSTHSFLLHVDDEGASIEVADAEEVDILVAAELLRRLGRVGTLWR